MVYLLDDQIGFPDPRQGEPDGFFAIGGDLSIERLQLAYSWGIFPWYAYRAEDTCPELIDPETGEPYIQWWCPMKRFVIFTDEIHISHSMRQMINKYHAGEYDVTINQAFDQVIDNCGKLREAQAGAWLGDKMKAAYTEMNKQGLAASVEVWHHGELVGGLYGVTLGRGFFGESMFSLEPSVSKLALIVMAKILKLQGVKLIDCQLETPHLRSMGGRFIDYDEYLSLIQNSLEENPETDF